MFSRAIIMGRIATDLSLKTTANNTEVVSFNVAVEKRYKSQDGKRHADFIHVVAWSNCARHICNYFHKGKVIHIDGTLQVRSYTDKNGIDREITEIVAENVCFCGDKEENNGSRS